MKNWIVTPEDLARGQLLPVGWHPAEIIKYEETEAGENAKNPGSTNCNFYFRIIDGEAKNAEVRRVFNESAWNFAKDFFATMKFPKDPKGNYQISGQLFEQTVGHKLMIYIKRTKDQKSGNEYNDVADFKPLAA